jgi:hypothetical protein
LVIVTCPSSPPVTLTVTGSSTETPVAPSTTDTCRAALLCRDVADPDEDSPVAPGPAPAATDPAGVEPVTGGAALGVGVQATTAAAVNATPTRTGSRRDERNTRELQLG